MITKYKMLKKNNDGVAWFLILAIGLIVAVIALSILVSYFMIQTHTANVKTKVQLELNNTSAQASQLILNDIAEHNYSTYLESFEKYEKELKSSFLVRLKRVLPLSSTEYAIDAASINLTFEAKDDFIVYNFVCQIDVKLYFAGAYRTIADNKDIAIHAKHYFKNDEPSTIKEYSYTPSKKDENNLN